MTALLLQSCGQVHPHDEASRMCSTHASLSKLTLCLHGDTMTPCTPGCGGEFATSLGSCCTHGSMLQPLWWLCCGALCETTSRAHMIENEADFVNGPKLLCPLRHLPARPTASSIRDTSAGELHGWHIRVLTLVLLVLSRSLASHLPCFQQTTQAASNAHIQPPLGIVPALDPVHNALCRVPHEKYFLCQGTAEAASMCMSPRRAALAAPQIPCVQVEPDQAARLWMSPRRTALTMPNRPYLGPGRSRSACDRRAISA